MQSLSQRYDATNVASIKRLQGYDCQCNPFRMNRLTKTNRWVYQGLKATSKIRFADPLISSRRLVHRPLTRSDYSRGAFW